MECAFRHDERIIARAIFKKVEIGNNIAYLLFVKVFMKFSIHQWSSLADLLEREAPTAKVD